MFLSKRLNKQSLCFTYQRIASVVRWIDPLIVAPCDPIPSSLALAEAG